MQDYTTAIINIYSSPPVGFDYSEETGEIIPIVNASHLATKKKLTIILKPDGSALYPHSWFLNTLLQAGNKNSHTAALALLAFQRFLAHENITYRDLTHDPMCGAPWLFADYLKDNLRHFDAKLGVELNPDGYALSTARAYISVVIQFYKWLHSANILTINDNAKPFDFNWVRRPREGVDQHKVLGHLNRSKAIYVQTTTLMQKFPKQQITPGWKKLKPLQTNHEEALINELQISSSTYAQKTKSLMVKLSIATGLRIQELVTFPSSPIDLPSEASRIPISIGPENGCLTKFDKQRTIEVPYELMLELHEYKFSKKRMDYLSKRNTRTGEEHKTSIDKLFISARGHAFSSNTMEKYFSGLRNNLRKADPSWYYRIQDLRSTFASNWLFNESRTRGIVYDLLIVELASLMGHESTRTTEKYIQLLKNETVQLRNAASQNSRASRANILQAEEK